MPDLALEPIYKITCPICHMDTLYSLLPVTSKKKVNYPSCHQSINVVDQYRRPDLEDPIQKLGLSRNLMGATDRTETNAPLLGKAFDIYMEAHNYRKSKKSVFLIIASFNQFLTAARLHENMLVETITKAHGRLWIEYMRTPKSFPARTIARAATIDAKLKRVRHFLEYCISQDWIAHNPFEGLSIPARIVTASRTRKEAFTDSEVSQIFEALKQFQNPPARWASSVPRRTEFYHVAMLLAFTGARCTEILQLDKVDVKQVDEIWVVDLYEGEGKALKNRQSVRKVPIHYQLQPIFLPWWKQQTGRKIFPLLHAEGSQVISRWFSNFTLKRTGIKRPAVSLHSLRHTVTQKLARARTYPPIQNRLLGHAIGPSVEERTYMGSLEFSVKELSDALEAIKFPVIG